MGIQWPATKCSGDTEQRGVDVSVIRIGGKKMTIAIFKQLPEYSHHGNDVVNVYGLVRYPFDGAREWVIWDNGKTLFKDPIRLSVARDFIKMAEEKRAELIDDYLYFGKIPFDEGDEEFAGQGEILADHWVIAEEMYYRFNVWLRKTNNKDVSSGYVVMGNSAGAYYFLEYVKTYYSDRGKKIDPALVFKNYYEILGKLTHGYITLNEIRSFTKRIKRMRQCVCNDEKMLRDGPQVFIAA